MFATATGKQSGFDVFAIYIYIDWKNKHLCLSHSFCSFVILKNCPSGGEVFFLKLSFVYCVHRVEIATVFRRGFLSLFSVGRVSGNL